MDHVVYLDAKADELGRVLNGEKSMIIRGAAGRKMPYGRVNVGDRLFFIENDGSGLIRAKSSVLNVVHSEKMEKEESFVMVQEYQDKLQLTDAQLKRWGGKRYLVLIEVSNCVSLEPFGIDRSEYGNMDDWLPVEDIERVKLD
jgi:hypothetical protein